MTSSEDGTVRVWYVQMKDLLEAGCQWVPRNFTWSEWSIYLEDIQGAYRPTCDHAPIPIDAISGIWAEVRQQILAGQIISATQRLEELNGWLQLNGQYKSYGWDIEWFIDLVSATATSEAQPPTTTPTPSITPSPMQPASPLRRQPTSLLPSPTATPTITGTSIAFSPIMTPKRSVTPTQVLP